MKTFFFVLSCSRLLNTSFMFEANFLICGLPVTGVSNDIYHGLASPPSMLPIFSFEILGDCDTNTCGDRNVWGWLEGKNVDSS